ncbi:serine/threonine-protein kinase [Solilutibacter silvestris]|uniref:Protein kinase domain n=1 Tax=Solilutibacter silvestris TaxID=1645665 RepID=A0A2K1Q0Y8_9GAMM|nr:serine/threonine-protein kinase [Lysobacter silvestris]PNS08690.1 Protein kinase domain [Lysobacter silvestris]
MKQDATRLQRALTLFEAVVDLPAGERLRQLDDACTNDPELRTAVESLLIADRTADSLPTEPAAWLEEARSLPADANEDISGLRFGPWQATGVLGRGGMGAVYRVERADGAYQQSAALKRIRMGLDSSEAQLRFLRERQILATLRHPNIARLIDGGVAGETPYFAMELVEGERIDHWCDERALSLRERVRLFLQVLDAVSEAHRNLVVHRDLKPSNVLVDAGGQAHLLDFGIAQLLEEDAEATQTHHRAFTPDFASPEQLRGEPVTTASDIYQLGVMLYQLACGRHPFGIEPGTPWHRKLAMLEKSPMLPSRAVDGDGANQRGTTSSVLSRQIHGDLDAVLLHAIARSPTARYPTVDAFRNDLNAWLDGRSVQARRPSRREWIWRMIRRNRIAFAAAAAVIAALVLGLGVALWEARQAHLSEAVAVQQRALAERNSRESAAIQETFERMLMHAMAVDGGRKTSVREMTDGAIRSIDTKSGRGDAARISLLLDLIHIYIVADQKDGAREMLDKVRPQALEAAKKQPVFAFRVKALEAGLLDDSAADKVPTYREAFRIARPLIATADESEFENVRNESVNYLRALEAQGQSADQFQLAREYYDLTRERYGTDSPRTLQMAIAYGRTLVSSGNHRDADRLLQDQLKLASNHYGADGQLATSIQSIIAANDTSVDGHWPRAEAAEKQLLDKYRNPRIDVLGERKVIARLSVVRLLLKQRRDDEARAELARVDDDLPHVYGDDRVLLSGNTLVLQAEQAWNEGKIAESQAKADAALAIAWPPLSYDLASSHADALLLSARARATGHQCVPALTQTVDALKIYNTFPQRLDDGMHWARAADIERMCGQPAAALTLARHAHDDVKRLPEPDSWRTGVVELALARALVAAGQPGGAQAYQRAESAFARIVPANHPNRVAIAKENKRDDAAFTGEAPW